MAADHLKLLIEKQGAHLQAGTLFLFLRHRNEHEAFGENVVEVILFRVLSAKNQKSLVQTVANQV